ncbi:DUF5392 family protein [Alkalihalobacterium elongatum]|uniref:DUF5392 family protein n=1 Tax=Alkalihalobacterium elongatum TaxID=2675466 RepID=UPI001C200C74|nr:DUF5392 family protein [Alkalihalobacterium elongatum]
MLPMRMDDVSSYSKREFEKLQHKIAPLVKKSTVFSIISITMISFSLINLYHLLFGDINNIVFTFIFSLLGAVGVALYKEVKFQNKEIYKTSIEYINDKIQKSEVVPEYSKEKFIEKVRVEPMNAFQVFSDFLSQEERIKKMGN